ncbi:LytR C-terminal domain-containing protein [Rhodococcus spongiicola]|uniref:LytR family transcriptional regulator n=1 Tax=Rhodococcus spongiicola TaxID=2487352 RepID=A0A438ASF7_9NOCA|nr:LytR C-terminal domain-containing protein [Rhodococcus spongiicola]RVW01651.1 LytR family transcriptional regulator [Rhodococcus spongiicola]
MTTPNPNSSGPPLRAIAMVLIALAILFAGLGAASLGALGGSNADESATEVAAGTSPTTTAPPAVTTTVAAPAAPPTTSPEGTGAAAAAPTGPVDKSVPVRVFNNSDVTGLAARTASELTSDGWTVSETANFTDGVIPTSTVYYGDDAVEKQAAEAIASELGFPAEPRFEGIAGIPPGVIVIVTSQ